MICVGKGVKTLSLKNDFKIRRESSKTTKDQNAFVSKTLLFPSLDVAKTGLRIHSSVLHSHTAAAAAVGLRAPEARARGYEKPIFCFTVPVLSHNPKSEKHFRDISKSVPDYVN